MSAGIATREPTTLAGIANAIQVEHDAATTAARTAIGYMRLSANRQRVADLGSVREALAALAAPREVITAAPDPAGEVDRELEMRRVQHVDVEDDLRRLFVRGEWRWPEHADWAPDAGIAWAVLGCLLRDLDQAGVPADFGYAGLDEYVADRLPDVDNAWLGLEFEMRAVSTGGAA